MLRVSSDHSAALQQFRELRHRRHHLVASGSDRVLGEIPDRESRDLQHREVVCAVADRDGPRKRYLGARRKRLQGSVLRPDDKRTLDAAGEPPVPHREAVRDDGVDVDILPL